MMLSIVLDRGMIVTSENIQQLHDRLTKVTAERDQLAAELAKLREQKPVAWMCVDGFGTYFTEDWNEVLGAKDVLAITALYAVPAPAVPALEIPEGDDFNGTTPHLIQCIEALVRMNDRGVLVPHGIGSHARTLLLASANRLRQQAAPAVPEDWRVALQEAHGTFQRYADLHRAKDTPDGHEKAKANQKLANKLYALLQNL